MLLLFYSCYFSRLNVHLINFSCYLKFISSGGSREANLSIFFFCFHRRCYFTCLCRFSCALDIPTVHAKFLCFFFLFTHAIHIFFFFWLHLATITIITTINKCIYVRLNMFCSMLNRTLNSYGEISALLCVYVKDKLEINFIANKLFFFRYGNYDCYFFV